MTAVHLPNSAPYSTVSSVVLVDPSQSLRAFGELLRSQSYTVHFARDAGQARVLVETQKPDFLWTELVLPRETGFELCAYLKRRQERLPVAIYTEVDLDIARNLAIWCRADAYFVKPLPPEELQRQMTSIGESVWAKFQLRTEATEGRIRFVCRCGKHLSVRMENGGKGVCCPSCQTIVQAPKFGTDAGGLWRRQEGGQVGPDRQEQPFGFFCSHCSRMLVLVRHRRSDMAVCSECGKQHHVPRWLQERHQLFFGGEPSTAEVTSRRYRLARVVLAFCPKCRGEVLIDPLHPNHKLHCQACGPIESVSLKGSPLATAALASTGRLVSFVKGPLQGRKFLLPVDQDVVLGSKNTCDLVLADVGLADQQCVLRYRDEQVVLMDPGSVDGIFVNNVLVENEQTLIPGDVVQLGRVEFRLAGHRTTAESEVSSIRVETNGQESHVEMGDARINVIAAEILQLHWERLRGWLKEHPDWFEFDDEVPREPSVMAVPQPVSHRPFAEEKLVERTGQAGPSNESVSRRTGAFPREAIPAPPLRLPPVKEDSDDTPVPSPSPAESGASGFRRSLSASETATKLLAHRKSGKHPRP